MLAAPRIACRLLSTTAATLQKAATAVAPAASATRIQSLKQNPLEKSIEVQWTDGVIGEFSYIWLRDSAPGTRRKYLSELNLEVKPENLTLSENGEELVIQWPPYTVNTYGTDFLRKYAHTHQPEDIPWEENGHVVKWDRSSVKIATPTLESFLKNPGDTVDHLEKYGIVCIRNCLMGNKGKEAIADEVMKKFVPESSVKTEVKLHKVKERADSMHTYGPHYKQAPHYVGMLFLEEADSQFQLADGFKIGSTLNVEHAELFDVLENVHVSYNDPEGNIAAHHPVFITDAVGKEVTQVQFNNTQRSIQGDLSTVQSEVFYKAIKAFHKECYRRENVVQMQIYQGDLLVFNNRRILYGHSAFTHPCDVLVTCYT